MSLRPVKRVLTSKPTMEGAGVRLRRGFGFGETNDYDPFLLFDDFRGDRPADYAAGFPWHPHRGIETMTYVLNGTVEHGDSLGNRGMLGAGDVQWMTAGSGILHQEMPQGDAKGRMHGFQLWANLPASHKMTAPRYQDIGGRQRAAQVAGTGPKQHFHDVDANLAGDLLQLAVVRDGVYLLNYLKSLKERQAPPKIGLPKY